jgi:hypothetical protein
MLNFYQLYEVLSSHGGIHFSPKPNSEEESIRNHLPRENLDDNKEIASKNVRFESLYFTPSDEKYISKMYAANNTKGIINGLDKMLSKVDDYDFHIFMGKPFFYGKYKDGKPYRQEMVHSSDLKKYFFETIKIPKDDIVFNKQSSSGDILTPWMILHSMAHAIFLSKLNTIKFLLYNFFDKITKVSDDDPNIADSEKSIMGFSIHQQSWGQANLNHIINLPEPNTKSEILPLLFNFKSVRTINPLNVEIDKVKMGRVSDVDELVHELFVYYLINGLEIPMPSQQNINKILSYTMHTDVEHLTFDIKTLFDNIKYDFKQRLKQCKGQVFTD